MSEKELVIDGCSVRFRPLNSLDLEACAEVEEKQALRRLLFARCVIEARHEGREIAAHHLPEPVIAGLAARLSECDPQAEVLLDLECPSCKHRWQTALDVAGFLWDELVVQARRLLREVHALAGTYGWSEADILAMSARRRNFYLELVAHE